MGLTKEGGPDAWPNLLRETCDSCDTNLHAANRAAHKAYQSDDTMPD